MQNVQRAERAAANPPRPTSGTIVFFMDVRIKEIYIYKNVLVPVFFGLFS